MNNVMIKANNNCYATIKAGNQRKPGSIVARPMEKSSLSFGSAVATGGLIAKVSKAATSLILKINQSRLPAPIKSWSTYMIANVPVLSNVVFKSPITEGDLIFAITAALPIARTISEVPERRKEAFLRDMSGFVVFLACVRAVQGLQWESALKGVSKTAKQLLPMAKEKSIALVNLVTGMFPDTHKMISEIARVDKVDDIVKAALSKGNLDDVIKQVLTAVKEPGVKDSALAYFERVPRAKEHFVKVLESASNSKDGLKETFKNFNKLKSYRSLAGAVIGGITYILISGVGINLLNQYLAKRKKGKNEQDKGIKPQGIPFAARTNDFLKVPKSDFSNIAGGHLSDRNQFLNKISNWN